MTNVNGISGVGNNDFEKVLKTEVSKPSDEKLWENEEISDNKDIDVDIDVESITGRPEKNKSPNKVKKFFEKALFKAGTLTRFTGLPVAGELLKLCQMSEEKREKRIKNNGGEILSPEESREMLAKFGLHEEDNGHTRPEQMQLQTIVFSNNDPITKKTVKNELLQDKVREWAKNGAKENEILDFNTSNSGSFDLRLGFGFTNILGLHLTDDGYAEGYVEDVYDYDIDYATGKSENEGFLKKTKTKAVQALDYMAVDLQNAGVIKNYRVLVPIRVKVETDKQA